MLRISYIIPCYNVERYVSSCIESLYLQGLSEDEFEVICVNDCSTDSTRDIILSLQTNHSNIRLVDQQENRLSGEARNRGLDLARGEFVWFVDSDDMLKPNVVKPLLEQMHAGDLEMLFFNFDEIMENHAEKFLQRDDIYGNWPIQDGLSLLKSCFYNDLSRVSLVWLCLFKRTFLMEKRIRFTSLIVSEDSIFMWQCLFEVKKLLSISDRCYIHRLNSNSIIQSSDNAVKSFTRSFRFPIAMQNLIGHYCDEIPNEIVDIVDGYVRYEVNQYALRYLHLSEEEKPKYYQAMRAEKEWYGRFKKYLSRKNRVLYHASALGETAFCKAAMALAK